MYFRTYRLLFSVQYDNRKRNSNLNAPSSTIPVPAATSVLPVTSDILLRCCCCLASRMLHNTASSSSSLTSAGTILVLETKSLFMSSGVRWTSGADMCCVRWSPCVDAQPSASEVDREVPGTTAQERTSGSAEELRLADCVDDLRPDKEKS